MHKWYNNLFICRWYIKCSIEYIWSMNWFTILTSFIKWYNNIIRCIKRMYWWLMMIRLYKNAVLTFAFVGAELMDGCEDDTFNVTQMRIYQQHITVENNNNRIYSNTLTIH
eukprot:1000781_1